MDLTQQTKGWGEKFQQRYTQLHGVPRRADSLLTMGEQRWELLLWGVSTLGNAGSPTHAPKLVDRRLGPENRYNESGSDGGISNGFFFVAH